MRIDLDELTECTNCGNVFNFVKASKKTGHDCDYARTKTYYGNCPCCKKEYDDEE